MAPRWPASRVWLGVVLWLVGTLPFLTRLQTGWTSWDLGHYVACARAFLDHTGIYGAVPFEYPPYALAWFAGPAAVARDVEQFRHVFSLMIWALDAGIKAALLWLGLRGQGRDLVPFVVYTLTTTALGHILLQRFDVIPAALSVAAVMAFASGWTGVAGAVIGVAIGTKAYPVLFVPVLVASVWRRDRSRALRFITGVAVALAPMAVTAVWGPWWRFLSAHTGRGLEAESLWSSAIWLLHYAGLPARWEIVTAWVEVTGPVASVLVTPVRVVWLTATAGATALAARLAWRGAGAGERAGERVADAMPIATLAVLLLLPAATFVTLGPVLSPQYHLWLAPLAAIALLGRHNASTIAGAPVVRRALGWLVVSGLLVPAFFPSRTFDTGLDLGRTLVLVLRNGLLLYSLAGLWRSVVAANRRVHAA